MTWCMIIINFILNISGFLSGYKIANDRKRLINYVSLNLTGNKIVREYKLQEFSMIKGRLWIISLLILSIIIQGLFVFRIFIRPEKKNKENRNFKISIFFYIFIFIIIPNFLKIRSLSSEK